jgi:Glycosyl transferase family 11
VAVTGNVVVLLGRLGNQLFQYSLAKWLEAQTGTPSRFDLSFVGRKGLAGPQVLRRELWDSRATMTPHLPVMQGRLAPAARAARWLLGPRRFVMDLSPEGTLGEVGTAAWWLGYWQRPDILVPATQHLREVFGVCTTEPVIRVHVRRGDYVRIGNATDPAWFRSAVGRLATTVAHDRVEVISDDPQWCRANLDLPVPFSVVGGTSAEEDFKALMRSAALVADGSTFAWWAAYLGQVPVLHGQSVLPKDLWQAVPVAGSSP